MLFNSFHFAVFYVVALALNQSLRPQPGAQKLMLLAASYYSYGQWNCLHLLGFRFPKNFNYSYVTESIQVFSGGAGV